MLQFHRSPERAQIFRGRSRNLNRAARSQDEPSSLRLFDRGSSPLEDVIWPRVSECSRINATAYRTTNLIAPCGERGVVTRVIIPVKGLYRIIGHRIELNFVLAQMQHVAPKRTRLIENLQIKWPDKATILLRRQLDVIGPFCGKENPVYAI